MTGAQPASNGPDVREWSVRRIDIRSPVLPDAWPVVRVELNHPQRGRVTDIGPAPGAFDAAFVAVSQIIGVRPQLQTFDVRSLSSTESGLSIVVEVVVVLDGQSYLGKSAGLDLV